MRTVLLALLLTASGCASQPPAAPPVVSVAPATSIAPVAPVAPIAPVAAATPVSPVAPSIASNATLLEARIVQAKRMGYKLRNQDGEEYFCRTELKTGSRVARETVCLTAKEIDSLRQQTQQGLANISHQVMPPPGH